MKRLGTDLTSAQKEMKAKHKAYENAVGILSRRLQEALTDKETAEAELVKLKAQVSDEGNSQALQVENNPGHNYPVWGLSHVLKAGFELNLALRYFSSHAKQSSAAGPLA